MPPQAPAKRPCQVSNHLVKFSWSSESPLTPPGHVKQVLPPVVISESPPKKQKLSLSRDKNQLPFAIISHILAFADLTTLFACSTVSKSVSSLAQQKIYVNPTSHIPKQQPIAFVWPSTAKNGLMGNATAAGGTIGRRLFEHLASLDCGYREEGELVGYYNHPHLEHIKVLDTSKFSLQGYLGRTAASNTPEASPQGSPRSASLWSHDYFSDEERLVRILHWCRNLEVLVVDATVFGDVLSHCRFLEKIFTAVRPPNARWRPLTCTDPAGEILPQSEKPFTSIRKLTVIMADYSMTNSAMNRTSSSWAFQRVLRSASKNLRDLEAFRIEFRSSSDAEMTGTDEPDLHECDTKGSAVEEWLGLQKVGTLSEFSLDARLFMPNVRFSNSLMGHAEHLTKMHLANIVFTTAGATVGYLPSPTSPTLKFDRNYTHTQFIAFSYPPFPNLTHLSLVDVQGLPCNLCPSILHSSVRLEQLSLIRTVQDTDTLFEAFSSFSGIGLRRLEIDDIVDPDLPDWQIRKDSDSILNGFLSPPDCSTSSSPSVPSHHFTQHLQILILKRIPDPSSSAVHRFTANARFPSLARAHISHVRHFSYRDVADFISPLRCPKLSYVELGPLPPGPHLSHHMDGEPRDRKKIHMNSILSKYLWKKIGTCWKTGVVVHVRGNHRTIIV